MVRSPNIYGGGAQTNANGLLFEQTTSLDNALENAGYLVLGYTVFEDDRQIGLSVSKKKFYKEFLEYHNINYKDYNSKGWQPDDAFINYRNNTVYIIEKKFQNVSGSVDEKLPNCHFKKLEYQKLCTPINFKVEFIYVLSDWFYKDEYRDTLEYIINMGCHYYFNAIPLNAIGL